MIPLDYDNHASSANCQSFLVHLAKAGQLELLQKLLEKMNEDCKPPSFFDVFALKCTIRSNSNAHPSECNYLSSTRTSKGTKTKKKSEIDDLGFVLHALLRAFSLFYTI